ncbi:hypothetical protein BaOVIS_014580 [Babesia ovis]|uniref:Cyclin N-terminal domain-containing protein n=1 Tax=Babesia ovis TaxID=5869 RepID=A0A9W5TDZ1_BABOV|nr:hypothetical protein BaOVIS_014580 [Babesia ovis]
MKASAGRGAKDGDSAHPSKRQKASNARGQKAVKQSSETKDNDVTAALNTTNPDSCSTTPSVKSLSSTTSSSATTHTSKDSASTDNPNTNQGGSSSPNTSCTANSSTTTISSLRERVRNNLRARFQLASQFMPTASAVEETHPSVSEAADTIVALCRALHQPFSVLLTALVYLQMYKNASDRWKSITSSICTGAKMSKPPISAATSDFSHRYGVHIERHENFLVAASCVLLAWKYREDDIRSSKSTGKIFEFTSVLYKLYVAQNVTDVNVPSVSAWMLQDEGKEITKLKTQLLAHEAHLLHALDYHVGPIPLPHKLIPTYVRKFIIATATDLSECNEVAKHLDHLVGLLILDCYKTRICIDYNPGEILVSCIFKGACLLSVSGLYPDIFGSVSEDHFSTAVEIESRLNNFLSTLGRAEISTNRISRCLADMRTLTGTAYDES